MLHLDLTKLEGFIPQDYLTQRMAGLEKAASMLANHDGPGGDFTGWVYPVSYTHLTLPTICSV